jgi:hypothetical protein
MRVQTLGAHNVPRKIVEAHALEHRALHDAGLSGLRSYGLGEATQPSAFGIFGFLVLGFVGAGVFGWAVSRTV